MQVSGYFKIPSRWNIIPANLRFEIYIIISYFHLICHLQLRHFSFVCIYKLLIYKFYFRIVEGYCNISVIKVLLGLKG